MFCTNCGAALPNGAEICPNCNRPVSRSSFAQGEAPVSNVNYNGQNAPYKPESCNQNYNSPSGNTNGFYGSQQNNPVNSTYNAPVNGALISKTDRSNTISTVKMAEPIIRRHIVIPTKRQTWGCALPRCFFRLSVLYFFGAEKRYSARRKIISSLCRNKLRRAGAFKYNCYGDYVDSGMGGCAVHRRQLFL